MKAFKNPQVRGEPVTIIYKDNGDTPANSSALNASAWPDSDVLVIYPDGEQGYVRESDITEK